MTQFWNFGTQFISRERLKLETSNLARRRTAASSDQKNAELGQKGSCGGHVTQFWNFGNPLISRERLKLESSNLARRRTVESFNEKMQKWVKRGHLEVTSPNSGILRPPNISRTVKLETSNLARKRKAVSSNEKNAKLGENRLCGVT